MPAEKPTVKAAKKTPAKKTTTKTVVSPADPRMTPPSQGVKVRMYRTGLGDCFLLAFPRRKKGSRRAFYVLLDCGVYFRTPEPGNATRIDEIVRDIRDSVGGRLDLLIVTHEHWDHVSAFHSGQSQALFANEIQLDELWMAWTENLSLTLAKDLHGGRKAARQALCEAVVRMQRLDMKSDGAFMAREILSFFGGLAEPVGAENTPGEEAVAPGNLAGARSFAAKSAQTEAAMDWIREVYGKGKTTFLHPGEGPLAFDGVAHARVYVLGPPEDPDLIRRADPRGGEVYPKAMETALQSAFFATLGVAPSRQGIQPDPESFAEARRMSMPFDEVLQIKREQIESALKAASVDPQTKEPLDRDLRLYSQYFQEDKSWRKIDGDWLEAAGRFALQLDNATNNTSLAFALEIGRPGKGKVLLFPGDAQVGNWLSWFGKVKLGRKGEVGKDMTWTVDGVQINAEDLLRRTVFYKVGHHGSHNATLREKGLELMGSAHGELVAFLPVDEHVARDLAHYGEMPLRSLIRDLAHRTGGRVARNDAGAEPKDSRSTLKIPVSSAFADESKNPLYFEYTVTP